MDIRITESVNNSISTFEKKEVEKIYQCIQLLRSAETMHQLYQMNKIHKLTGNNNFYICRVNVTIRIIFRLNDGILETVDIFKKDRIEKLKDFGGREEM